MKIRSIVLAVSAVLAGAGSSRGQGVAPTPTPGYVEAFKPSASDSVEARQARTAARLGRKLVGGETQLLRSFAGLYQEVWQNSDGLTPQQVCDALGNKAGNLFVIAGIMSNALSGIDPVGLGSMVGMPPGYSATLHADGSVTVTFVAPSPSPSPVP